MSLLILGIKSSSSFPIYRDTSRSEGFRRPVDIHQKVFLYVSVCSSDPERSRRGERARDKEVCVRQRLPAIASLPAQARRAGGPAVTPISTNDSGAY
jgi:hypothetical protein